MNLTGYSNIDNCDPRTCIASKVNKAQRLVSNIYRKHLASSGITSSQLSILFVLSKKGKVTQQALADFLQLEKSSMSRNKKRLIEAGFIEVQKLNLFITKKGLEMLNDVVPFWDLAMKEAKDKLGKDGLESLNVLSANLETM